MWEPFHVDLGPQPMHLDITPELGQLSKFETCKYDERGMVVVDPLPTHCAHKTSYLFGVDVGTIPCRSGASTNAP
jgi:hypothetical protein